MYFYKRDSGRQQGIANGDAGMREGCWINNDEIDVVGIGLMNQFHDFVFGIVLMKIQLMAQVGRSLFKRILYVGECLVSVMAGFSDAQQV